MRHIQGSDRAQTLVLPAAVEDYVEADNQVRAPSRRSSMASTCGRRASCGPKPKTPGVPVTIRAISSKLYPYGYLNRIRSSQRLEAETHRNLEVMWLLRGLGPDYKTIADFRRESAPAFKAAFRHFVRLCRKLDLFGRELLAVDGTRLKAVNGRKRNLQPREAQDDDRQRRRAAGL